MSACVQSDNSPTPFINVTPLIDVLLVVLIIFMVVTPLKPSRFVAKLPAPPEDRAWPPNPKTLVVTIESDHTLKLNSLGDMGTVDDMGKLRTCGTQACFFSSDHPVATRSDQRRHPSRHRLPLPRHHS